MSFINLKSESKEVKAVFTIQGADLWWYEYKGDETFVNSHKLDLEKKHSLGISKDVIHDYHSFKIEVANLSDDDRKIKVVVEWFEGDELVGTWRLAKSDSDGRVEVKGNSKYPRIFDSILFI